MVIITTFGKRYLMTSTAILLFTFMCVVKYFRMALFLADFSSSPQIPKFRPITRVRIKPPSKESHKNFGV